MLHNCVLVCWHENWLGSARVLLGYGYLAISLLLKHTVDTRILVFWCVFHNSTVLLFRCVGFILNAQRLIQSDINRKFCAIFSDFAKHRFGVLVFLARIVRWDNI